MACGKSNEVVWIRVRVSSTGQRAPPTQLIMNTVQPRLTATSLILVPSVQPPVTFLSEIPINPATSFIWPDFYAPIMAVVTGSQILFLRGPVCRSAGLFVCLFLCLSLCLPVSKSAVCAMVGLAKKDCVLSYPAFLFVIYAPPIRASISRLRQEHAGTCGRKMKAGCWVAASFSLPRAQEGAAPVGTLHCMQVIP